MPAALGVTIDEGVTIDGGVTLSGGAGPVQYGDLQFNPLYTANGALTLSNNNETVVDNYPGIYSTLTTYQLNNNIKVMVSYRLDFYTDPISYVGIGLTSTDLGTYLGADNNSIGVQSDGTYYYGGSQTGSGLPNFTNQGDIIDFCIDTVSNVFWIRVNNGLWNNDSGADPAINTGGISFPSFFNAGYPALSVGGQNFYSIFSIKQTATYAVPNGFTFIPDSFTIQPVALNGWTGGITPNGTIGFDSNGAHTLTYQFVYIDLSNSVVGDTIADYWTRNNLVADQSGYVFNASWGGSPGSDKVMLAFYNSNGFRSILIAPIDTSTNAWQTPGTDVNTLQGAAGTYNWPATFELYLPVIHDNNNWC